MKVSSLDPNPEQKVAFDLNQRLLVPSSSGCYVLSNIYETILYVGLSNCLARRFDQHLDSPDKTAQTPLGRAIWFHWLRYENLEMLERTWLNSHEVAEGKLPYFNSVRSPM